MAVYERPTSPFWWAYLEQTGERLSTKIPKGVTLTERKESHDQAVRWYHARCLATVAEAIDGPPPPAPITFATFAAWYDTHVVETHRGKERERTILPRLVAAFGDLELGDPRWRERAIAWRTTRSTTGHRIAHFGGPKGKPRQLPPPAPRTVNREFDLLQQILQAAADAKHMPASPLYGIENLKTTEPIRRTTSDEEERRLQAVMRPEDWAIYVVGTDALVRLNDILALTRADDRGAELEIVAPKNGVGLKVPVSSRLRAALDALPAARATDPTAPYFPLRARPATEAARRNGYAKALQRACKKAGLPYGRKARGITFHWGTRRTGATRMIRRGGEKAIAVAQRIGGWKDVGVLIGIYQETITAEMRAAVESVAPPVAAPGPEAPAAAAGRRDRGGPARALRLVRRRPGEGGE